MGNFDKKIEKFLEIFIDQNGYKTVIEGLQNTLMIAIIGLIVGIVIGTLIATVRVLPKYKTVIFVNGCFWHKHNCKRFVWPPSNEEYWKKKILRNVERDELNIKELKELGWKVLVVWECELKKAIIDKRLETLVDEIRT